MVLVFVYINHTSWADGKNGGQKINILHPEFWGQNVARESRIEPCAV